MPRHNAKVLVEVALLFLAARHHRISQHRFLNRGLVCSVSSFWLAECFACLFPRICRSIPNSLALRALVCGYTAFVASFFSILNILTGSSLADSRKKEPLQQLLFLLCLLNTCLMLINSIYAIILISCCFAISLLLQNHNSHCEYFFSLYQFIYFSVDKGLYVGKASCSDNYLFLSFPKLIHMLKQ